MRRRGSQPDFALSPQLCARIARYIFNGFDNEEISLATSLPEDRIKQIRKGSLNRDVRKAVIGLKDKAIERVKRGRGKLTGLVWFLERRYPRQFARPDIQLQLATSPTVNNTLVISAEAAEGLLKRSKQVTGEIDQLILDKQPEIASDAQ